MCKEIPAGSPLQLVSDMVPDSFENLNEAVEFMLEVLKKGDFSVVHLHVNDGEGSLNMGFLGLDKTTNETTDEDRSKILGLSTAGARILAKVPLPMALKLLSQAYMQGGDLKDALALGAAGALIDSLYDGVDRKKGPDMCDIDSILRDIEDKEGL